MEQRIDILMKEGAYYIDSRFGLRWKCLKATADGGFKVQLDGKNGPTIEHTPKPGNICTIRFLPEAEG